MELIKVFYRATPLKKIIFILVVVWLVALIGAALSSNNYPRGYSEERGGLMTLGCKATGKSYTFQKEDIALFPIPHLEDRAIQIYSYNCSNIGVGMLGPYPEI